MSAGLNIGAGSPPGEKSKDGPSITVDGSYYDKDVEGISHATVAGQDGVDINIRDEAANGARLQRPPPAHELRRAYAERVCNPVQSGPK